MAENPTEGQVIAKALEKIWGDGNELGGIEAIFNASGHKALHNYRLCLERLKSGSHGPEDLDFASGLIDIGSKYNSFDLEATRNEKRYLQKRFRGSEGRIKSHGRKMAGILQRFCGDGTGFKFENPEKTVLGGKTVGDYRACLEALIKGSHEPKHIEFALEVMKNVGKYLERGSADLEKWFMSNGNLIADALEGVCGDGSRLKFNHPTEDILGGNVGVVYCSCLKALRSGSYGPKEIRFALELLRTAGKYNSYDLEMTRIENQNP